MCRYYLCPFIFSGTGTFPQIGISAKTFHPKDIKTTDELVPILNTNDRVGWVREKGQKLIYNKCARRQ